MPFAIIEIGEGESLNLSQFLLRHFGSPCYAIGQLDATTTSNSVAIPIAIRVCAILRRSPCGNSRLLLHIVILPSAVFQVQWSPCHLSDWIARLPLYSRINSLPDLQA